MLSGTLITPLSLILPAAIAYTILPEDVPEQCKTICQPIMNLTSTCDVPLPMDQAMAASASIPSGFFGPKVKRQHGKRDDGHVHTAVEDPNHDHTTERETDVELETICICRNRSFDVSRLSGLCASCFEQNRGNQEKVNSVMSGCSFSSTSYAPEATSIVAGITVLASRPERTPGVSSIVDSTPTGAAAASPTSGADNNHSFKGIAQAVGALCAITGVAITLL